MVKGDGEKLRSDDGQKKTTVRHPFLSGTLRASKTSKR